MAWAITGRTKRPLSAEESASARIEIDRAIP